MWFYQKSLFFIFLFIIIQIMITIYISHQQRNRVPNTSNIQNIEYTHSITKEFSCHYLKQNDSFNIIDDSIKFPLNSIFYIESSCNDLTSRQLCSIESAVRANPYRHINVLFTSPINKYIIKHSALKTLLSMKNVAVFRIHLEDYANGTPLQAKFKKQPLSSNDLNMEIGDILKYLTIYKYTGTYLAMDVIVARSFENLPANWVVKETPALMTADMFSFSSNDNGRALAHVALNVLMNDLAMVEGEYAWRFDSTAVMTKLVQTWCGISDILFLSSAKCQELEVGLPELFYPISFQKRQAYFRAENWEQWKTENEKVFTYQIWERFTKQYMITRDSLYGNLANKYCPSVYEFYGEQFGKI